jgi:hypothetical protein
MFGLGGTRDSHPHIPWSRSLAEWDWPGGDLLLLLPGCNGGSAASVLALGWTSFLIMHLLHTQVPDPCMSWVGDRYPCCTPNTFHSDTGHLSLMASQGQFPFMPVVFSFHGLAVPPCFKGHL